MAKFVVSFFFIADFLYNSCKKLSEKKEFFAGRRIY